MFIIYEYAACLFVALVGAALLSAVGVMFIVLKEAGSMGARRLRELTRRATWLVGRWTAEPREP
ncbi:MAG: hypothetical protein ABSF14_22975 [Terriglobia bacterium]|jgi:hypothetical protein